MATFLLGIGLNNPQVHYPWDPTVGNTVGTYDGSILTDIVSVILTDILTAILTDILTAILMDILIDSWLVNPNQMLVGMEAGAGRRSGRQVTLQPQLGR